MEKRAGGLYLYMVMLFSLVVLAYSIWILYNAYASYEEGKLDNFYAALLMSSVGIVLALSSLTRMRKRIAVIYAPSWKSFSVVLCRKCGFKIVRAFSAGDYVHKSADKCQQPQCDGSMTISSIYAEKPVK